MDKDSPQVLEPLPAIYPFPSVGLSSQVAGCAGLEEADAAGRGLWQTAACVSQLLLARRGSVPGGVWEGSARSLASTFSGSLARHLGEKRGHYCCWPACGWNKELGILGLRLPKRRCLMYSGNQLPKWAISGLVSLTFRAVIVKAAFSLSSQALASRTPHSVSLLFPWPHLSGSLLGFVSSSKSISVRAHRALPHPLLRGSQPV